MHQLIQSPTPPHPTPQGPRRPLQQQQQPAAASPAPTLPPLGPAGLALLLLLLLLSFFLHLLSFLLHLPDDLHLQHTCAVLQTHARRGPGGGLSGRDGVPGSGDLHLHPRRARHGHCLPAGILHGGGLPACLCRLLGRPLRLLPPPTAREEGRALHLAPVGRWKEEERGRGRGACCFFF